MRCLCSCSCEYNRFFLCSFIFTILQYFSSLGSLGGLLDLYRKFFPGNNQPNTLFFIYLSNQCPHDGKCPLENSGKYCHFVQRLERTSTQRAYKVHLLSIQLHVTLALMLRAVCHVKIDGKLEGIY